MVQSFSAKGHPYANAVMECFFKYLKKEGTNRHNYSSLSELKLSLFKYINGFYNSSRPHSHNNGLTPNHAEEICFARFSLAVLSFLLIFSHFYPFFCFSTLFNKYKKCASYFHNLHTLFYIPL